MSAAMNELSGGKKMSHLFDSFEGLPPAKEIDGQAAAEWQQNTTNPNYYENCSADESFAKGAMALTGHSNYSLNKGWFQNTLENYKGSKISILRLDGDWYESTMICLQKFYPLVSTGGIIMIDDYYTWDGCSRAVHDYFSKMGLTSRVHQWNNLVAFVIKAD
jgi:O-methyltransferase